MSRKCKRSVQKMFISCFCLLKTRLPWSSPKLKPCYFVRLSNHHSSTGGFIQSINRSRVPYPVRRLNNYTHVMIVVSVVLVVGVYTVSYSESSRLLDGKATTVLAEVAIILQLPEWLKFAMFRPFKKQSKLSRTWWCPVSTAAADHQQWSTW